VRVLHLIDHLGAGGSQTTLVDLLEVRGADIDPSVWCLSRRILPELSDRLGRTGVSPQVLGLSKANPLHAVELRRRLISARPDVVHAHLEYSSVLAAAATPRSSGAKVVLHVDNDVYQRPRLARLALRTFRRRVDGFIAVSHGVRDAALRGFGNPTGRMVVVPPGIDTRRFHHSRVDPAMTANFRRGASRVVGSVGRLSSQKAFHVLIDAMPRLLAVDPGTRLLLVGDGPLRTKLERQAQRLGVAHAISLIGHMPDVLPAYAAMDVFVLPSKYEGFGVVFLEAMASGVPIVGTRVVGSVEAVEDGVTGLLVGAGDSAGLAHAILRVLSQPDLRDRIVSAAKAKVLRDHTRERTAASTESFYRELIASETRGFSHV
jgi:glycosyltransferase involved in cell wall biosynthesis